MKHVLARLGLLMIPVIASVLGTGITLAATGGIQADIKTISRSGEAVLLNGHHSEAIAFFEQNQGGFRLTVLLKDTESGELIRTHIFLRDRQRFSLKVSAGSSHSRGDILTFERHGLTVNASLRSENMWKTQQTPARNLEEGHVLYPPYEVHGIFFHDSTSSIPEVDRRQSIALAAYSSPANLALLLVGSPPKPIAPPIAESEESTLPPVSSTTVPINNQMSALAPSNSPAAPSRVAR